MHLSLTRQEIVDAARASFGLPEATLYARLGLTPGVSRVQTDLKSVLAYASMTQASLILVEIGLGWRVIPLVHVVGHAIVRSLQILRSPSALHDRHELEAALGGHPGPAGQWPATALPAAWPRTTAAVAMTASPAGRGATSATRTGSGSAPDPVTAVAEHRFSR